MDNVAQDLDPNILQNMIRQRGIMNSLGNGGLPQPMPEAPQAPDLTVHHLHGLMPDSPQVTPQAQEAMSPVNASPAPSPSPNTSPTPKIGPIDPNSVSPAESAYKQALMNEPMHGDYHPSTGRKILGVLGGIGAGIVSPGDKVQAGVQAGDAIRDAPFNSQHRDWAQFAGNKNTLATEEAAGDVATGKAATDAALIAERNSTANKNIREVQNMRNSPDEVLADKTTEAQAHLKTDTREAKMLDGSIKHLVQRNGLFYDPEKRMSDGSMLRVDRAAIEDISDEGKTLKETKTSRIPGNLGESIKARQIVAEGTDGENKYDQATVDAAKEFVSKADKGKDLGHDDKFIAIQQKVAEGETLTPDEKAYDKAYRTFTDVSKTQPGVARTVGPVMLGPADTTGTRTVESAKPGNKIASGSVTTSGESQINTPTAATRTRGEAAKTAIASGNDVISFVDKNKDKLGNVENYWNNLIQNTPAADPTVEDFRGRVASWAAQQAAAHGFRASTVMREFESRVGSTKNPEAIKSAIKGINDELENAVNTGNGTKSVQATKRYNPATGQIEDIK